MRNIKKQFLLYTILIISLISNAQDIYRFEHFDTKDGLSQSSVSSILCDKKGFLWIGTRNGLNRYDGFNFKIYNQQSGGKNNFTNNRIIKLWQDSLDYIWLETYDHYFHSFNPRREVFNSFPDYNDPDFNKVKQSSFFLQYSTNEVWVGTSGRGIYYLKHQPSDDAYERFRISDKGRYTITNNNVRFILADKDSNIWVGTQHGINLLPHKDFRKNTFNFQHLFIHYSFHSAVETNQEIWFSTEKYGIVVYNKNTSSYRILSNSNSSFIQSNHILKLFKSPSQDIFIASKNHGLAMVHPSNHKWKNIDIHGHNVENIYFDYYNNAWITTDKYGLTRYDITKDTSETYQIAKHKAITDLERHVFYEDRDSNLWIGLHGGALSFYDRKNNTFINHSNELSNDHSIASDIVHCITEDKTGLMWVGTGQYKGGLEKIIKKNPAFHHILLKKNIQQITDNLVRSITQDPNGCIWTGTKSGELYVIDEDLQEVIRYDANKPIAPGFTNTNIYTIFFDNNHYVWIGSKGHGLFVSTSPLPPKTTDYTHLRFINYQHAANNPYSLCNNNIYSIKQDPLHNIWIGTFGNGISITNAHTINSLEFENYNSNNSTLSNNLVRDIEVDTDSNIWVATSFGLNVLPMDSLSNHNIKFRSFFKDINSDNSLNYNDIIEIYEDSKKRLWFGTSGGGVSTIQLPLCDSPIFSTLTSKGNGLSNNAVFGILEDQNHKIWFSTEYGLNRYDNEKHSIEIFNTKNGLSFNSFSENTSCKLKDGALLFGGTHGIELLHPNMIDIPNIQCNIEFTNFQLFNKDVVIGKSKSPLNKSITFTKEIQLSHKQSSFSIQYRALDFLDPEKTQYAFILKGFEHDWNYVGNQTKATYTNLPHGMYTFMVKNTNRNGQWTTHYKTLTIEILPPWWKSFWAYSIYAIILIMLLMIVRSIVLRVQKYRNDLLLEKKINELKLRFFTNISHEIRTPLTLILGPLEDILEENTIGEHIQKQLILMRKNTKRMLQLVNQLLDFRRIQNNKMTLKVQEIDLNEFAQDIYTSFIPLAKHNGIRFKINPYHERINIWADIIQIDSILYNLISNALKYTPRGKQVTITIFTDTEADTAKIQVIDEGPGIPNDHIADIFSRYVILNNNSNMSSGIGLSLAFELAKLHGGNIELKSEVGKGSTFCLSLPLNKQVILEKANVSAIENTNISPVANHDEELIMNPQHLEQKPIDKNIDTILIVEDNTSIASYIKDKLSYNYNCFVAGNGIQGLQLAEVHNPDVIITDIMMPELDGIEMTKKLKENFSTCHIPIIMMTAKCDTRDKISGFETGAEAYITKPLNSSYLKAVIHSLIKQRKLVISKFRDNKTIDPKTLKVNTKDEKFMQDLMKYIETNYSKDLGVEGVAEHFFVSRTVFYNKVKGLTGLSPLEYIRQVKLKIALELLQKGYTVADAAFKIGYTDAKYFSKQFKMMFGYPPSKVKHH